MGISSNPEKRQPHYDHENFQNRKNQPYSVGTSEVTARNRKLGTFRISLLALGALGILTLASCAYDPYYGSGGGHHYGGGGYGIASYGYGSGYGYRYGRYGRYANHGYYSGSHDQTHYAGYGAGHSSEGHQGGYAPGIPVVQPVMEAQPTSGTAAEPMVEAEDPMPQVAEDPMVERGSSRGGGGSHGGGGGSHGGSGGHGGGR